MQIIHHDVKPSNILVDTEGHCILSDYGGSCETSAGEKRTSWMEGMIPIFTVRYAAPELLLDGPADLSYGTAADFWSLGATLFELATGRVSDMCPWQPPLRTKIFLARTLSTRSTMTRPSLPSEKVALTSGSSSSSHLIQAFGSLSLRSVDI